MKTNHQILQELDKLEQQAGLYEVEIEGIPIWRIVRFEIRLKVLNKMNGFKNKSVGIKLNKIELLKYFILSFFNILKLFFYSKNVNNIVVAFPRLFEINNFYIDKFTDPVISGSNLINDSIIFQHSFGNKHYKNRKKYCSLYYLDFIDIFSRILSFFFSFLYLFFNLKKISALQKKTKAVYPQINLSKFFLARRIFTFVISSKFYSIILFKLKPNNIFLVNREMFNFVVYAAKKRKIKVFEFQHGITQTETPMYTGPYLSNFDPDFFLTFGEAWKNAFFGIPQEKIFNIGWAYKDYVKNIKVEIEDSKSDTFLVISSPSITQKIIDFVSKACEFNANFKFDIRLHPQEKLSLELENFINNNKNINIISNREDSIFSIKKYNIIIGDNSSVLYEAISLGKKVGKINFEGIFTRNVDDDLKNGFFIINNFSDLERSLSFETQMSNEHYYSTFNQNLFNKLIL